jgi:hypothetical protein
MRRVVRAGGTSGSKQVFDELTASAYIGAYSTDL